MNERMRNIMLGMIFFWAPLAFFPRAAEGFTLTKELLAVSGLAFVLAGVSGAWRRVAGLGISRAFLGFTVWTLGMSLFTAKVPSEAWKGSVHYLLLAGTFFAVLAVPGERDLYRRLLRYALLAGVLMAVYGILQGWEADRSLKWATRFDGRVFSTLGNPNYLGGHLAAVLPAAFLMAWSGSRRRFWGACALLILAALLMTRVRGSYLALGVSFAVLGFSFLVPWGRPLEREHRKALWTGYALALLLALAMVARLGGFSIFSMKGETALQRLDTWKVTWRMVQDHALLGSGIDQLKVLYPAYQHRPYDPEDYASHPFTYTEHVHNEFLRFHQEGGLVGLVLFLAVLAFYAKGLAGRLSDPGLGRDDRVLLLGSLGGVTAVLVQSLSNFPLQIAPTTTVFALFLAAPWSVRSPIGEGTPHREGPRTVRVEGRSLFPPFLLLALVLLAGMKAISVSVAYRNLVGEIGLGNFRQAVEYGKRLLALDPSHYKAWFHYGRALEGERLPATAIEAYGKASSLHPYYVEALAAEAATRMHSGQYVEAFTQAEKAAAIAPNYAPPHFIRGAALFQFGRYDMAASAFRQASVLSPDDFDTWLNLGTCRIRAGDRTGAVAAWRRARDLRPGDRTVASYLRANGVP